MPRLHPDALNKLPADLETATQPADPTLAKLQHCEICGEAYDLNDIEQVFQHSGAHEPGSG